MCTSREGLEARARATRTAGHLSGFGRPAELDPHPLQLSSTPPSAEPNPPSGLGSTLFATGRSARARGCVASGEKKEGLHDCIRSWLQTGVGMPLPRVGALVLLFLIAVDTQSVHDRDKVISEFNASVGECPNGYDGVIVELQDPATGGRRLGTGDADVARNYYVPRSIYQCMHEND